MSEKPYSLLIELETPQQHVVVNGKAIDFGEPVDAIRITEEEALVAAYSDSGKSIPPLIVPYVEAGGRGYYIQARRMGKDV